jgi:taurine dioxygenase
MGPPGEDPYIHPIPGHPRVIAVRRQAHETTPIFAESWHSDWSFLNPPPAGTALHGMIIPPEGGDTLFADQYAAYEALPARTKDRLAGRYGLHSARRGYAPDGLYGEKDKGRSMSIVYSADAQRTQRQPIFRTHPETGRTALFVSPGYTIGIEDMSEAEAESLLIELFQHQTRPAFVYRHRWSVGMLTLWDNRCLLHRATGGYEGHERLLYRVTVAQAEHGEK